MFISRVDPPHRLFKLFLNNIHLSEINIQGFIVELPFILRDSSMQRWPRTILTVRNVYLYILIYRYTFLAVRIVRGQRCVHAVGAQPARGDRWRRGRPRMVASGGARRVPVQKQNVERSRELRKRKFGSRLSNKGKIFEGYGRRGRGQRSGGWRGRGEDLARLASRRTNCSTSILRERFLAATVR